MALRSGIIGCSHENPEQGEACNAEKPPVLSEHRRRRPCSLRSAGKMMNDDLEDGLRKLSDQWCERKALLPLHHFLPGYFALNGLTDGLAELENALKDVLAFARKGITEEEASEVKRIIVMVQQARSTR